MKLFCKFKVCISSFYMNCKLEKFWNNQEKPPIWPYIWMNCKLEKFWNLVLASYGKTFTQWTVNLKSFEIGDRKKANGERYLWTVNLKSFEISKRIDKSWVWEQMNCKLEKFWNWIKCKMCFCKYRWTVNLKSFEIPKHKYNLYCIFQWTVNLKSFEITVSKRVRKDKPLYEL